MNCEQEFLYNCTFRNFAVPLHIPFLHPALVIPPFRQRFIHAVLAV